MESLEAHYKENGFGPADQKRSDLSRYYDGHASCGHHDHDRKGAAMFEEILRSWRADAGRHPFLDRAGRFIASYALPAWLVLPF
jgi:hypothetical protein